MGLHLTWFSPLIISSTLSLLLLLNYPKTVLTDFRFCYNGPHRFNFADCPGGVLFKNSIPSECTFFAKGSDIGDGRAQVNGDICDSLVAEDADISSTNPIHSFGLGKIQEITYDGDLKEGTEGVDISAQPDCFAQCLGGWTDPFHIPEPGGVEAATSAADLEQLYQFPAPTDEVRAKQAKITQKLFTKLLMDDQDDFNSDSSRNQLGTGNEFIKTDKRIIDLLKDSFAVMTTHCPHMYLPEVFVDKAIKTMVYLLDNADTVIKDIGLREYEQVRGVLAQCCVFDRHTTFHLITKDCEEQPLIVGANFTKKNGDSFVYKYRNKNYKMEKYDPFIEAAWSAVSFVHGQCFRNFRGEFNLHHIYIVAMEAMFNIKTVLERWVVAPPEFKADDIDFWNNVMGVVDFVGVRSNVNACMKLAYVTESPPSPYTRSLNRPFKTLNGTEAVDADDRAPGWTRPESEYWSQYRKNGGFKKVIKAFGGTCSASDSEREAALASVQASCEVTSSPY